MVILHIARVDDNPFSGSDVVVPLHVKHQGKYAECALWNIKGVKLNSLDRTLIASELSLLPSPFNAPDLAVFHQVYIPQFPKIATELRKKGIPYVIIPHGSLKKTAQQKSRYKKLIANALIFKSYCTHAAGIQCLSENELNESVFGRYKFISTNGIVPADKQKTEFSGDKLRFVYVGRLDVHNKGLDIMIKAFAAEKSFLTEHNCTLDIYGPYVHRGEHFYDTIKGIIDSENANEVISLHDAVTGEEKKQILLQSDVFVQTSRSEGMPMGVLEALSMGLPCLVTEGTTLARHINRFNAGWGVDTEVSAIRKAIRTAVLEIDMLPEKGANALEAVKEFDWNAVSKTAVEEYKKILQRS